MCLIGTISPGATVGLDVVAPTPPGFPATPGLGIVVTLSSAGNDNVVGTAGPVVVAPTPGQSAGFVPPGGTISTGTNATPENNTVASFRLPKSGAVAPIYLRAEAGGVASCCAVKACSGKVLFLSQFGGYRNKLSPAGTNITGATAVARQGP